MDISEELRAAYTATRFVAQVPEGELVILIGHGHPAVDSLLSQTGETDWVFISAWNPKSVPTSAEANSAAQLKLESELIATGLRYFPGEGVPPDAGWESEASFLVLGVDWSAATELGKRYGQNAIVIGQSGGAAELVFCEP